MKLSEMLTEAAIKMPNGQEGMSPARLAVYANMAAKLEAQLTAYESDGAVAKKKAAIEHWKEKYNECQRELHLVKADDPEGAAFGLMVLHVMKERDLLREAIEHSIRRGNQNNDIYITQPLVQALAAIKDTKTS